MVDNSREVRRQIFDVIGCIAAVVTVLVYLVLCINANWPFIPEGSFVLNILTLIKTFAPLVVVALVGIDHCSNSALLLRKPSQLSQSDRPSYPRGNDHS